MKKMKSTALTAVVAGLIMLPALANADDATAQSVKPAETQEASKFDKLDANHDGKISHDEWTAHSDEKFKHISAGAADITKEAWDKWQKEEEAEEKEEKTETPKAGK